MASGKLNLYSNSGKILAVSAPDNLSNDTEIIPASKLGDKIEGDLDFINSQNGIILVDRNTSTKYRLFIEDGSLNLEEV